MSKVTSKTYKPSFMGGGLQDHEGIPRGATPQSENARDYYKNNFVQESEYIDWQANTGGPGNQERTGSINSLASDSPSFTGKSQGFFVQNAKMRGKLV